MDSQLWVPVPKLQTSKQHENNNKDQPKPGETKDSHANKNNVPNSNKLDSERRSSSTHSNVNIAKVLVNQEKLNLGIKINKKRTLDDMFDDDENDFPSSVSKSNTFETGRSNAECVSETGSKKSDSLDSYKQDQPKDDFKLGNSVDESKTLDKTSESSYFDSLTKLQTVHLDKDVSVQKEHKLKDPDFKRQKTDSSSSSSESESFATTLSNASSEAKESSIAGDESSSEEFKTPTVDLKLKVIESEKVKDKGVVDFVDKKEGKQDNDGKKEKEDKKVDTVVTHVVVKKEMTEEKQVVDDEKVVKPKPKTKKKEPEDLDKKVKKEPAVKKEKKLDVVAIEDSIEPINRWWEEIDDDMDYNKGLEFENKSRHWKYLEHNGLMFTPEYVPHNVPIKVKDETVQLPPHLEELATFWAQSMGSNYETSEIYMKNFWEAFAYRFEKGHVVRRSKLSDVDFSLIKNYLEEEKQKKKDNREFYKAKQQEEAKKEYKFNYALVDWVREKVSSNKIEPPGLFKGRGLHPKQGKVKSRMFPKDVILNLSKDAPVPKVSYFQREGHCWKDIYHDNTVTWLAYYKDSINDQFKYMYLSAQSKFKGFHDFLKYNKARELKAYIQKIRDDYNTKMLSPDMYERQIGTAIYLIDFLALRVGGEKDADEADTVGCCSLRVEHIKFNEEKGNTITLDFLGKDSIRYYNTLNDVAYDNLSKFCNRKKPSDEIFNKINTTKLNDYLKELMDGLSAKVFRTYNASITLQNQFKRLRPKQKKNMGLFGLVPSFEEGENLENNLNENNVNGVLNEGKDVCTSRTSSSYSSGGVSRASDETNLTTADSIDINNVDDLENQELEYDNEGEKEDKDGSNKEKKNKIKEENKDKDTKNVTVDLSNVSELLQFYNYANREVAILCNHQRSVPKQHETSMSKLKAQASMLKEDIQELNEYLKYLQSDSKEEFKFTSKTKDVNGNPRKMLTKPGMKLDSVKKKLATLKKKQKDHVIKMRIKDSNKTVALGTSKINYMDPRITVAFCKKYEIPIEKVFNKSLRMKFPWAMYVRSDFTF